MHAYTCLYTHAIAFPYPPAPSPTLTLYPSHFAPKKKVKKTKKIEKIVQGGVRVGVRDRRRDKTTLTHVSARTHTCIYVPIHTLHRIPLPANPIPDPNPIPLPFRQKNKNKKNKKIEKMFKVGLGLG